jgi:hypothetical protein
LRWSPLAVLENVDSNFFCMMIISKYEETEKILRDVGSEADPVIQVLLHRGID